ncbi:hypothetical protein P0F17_000605 [Vibrio metschnikovii]|nr:hypothetical protein [Vibrio metschnikovii]
MNESNLTAHEALQMAREANAVAKQLNEETKEQIAATRNMHDAMLLNQRRISFALCQLLPKQIADNIVLSNGSVIGFLDTGSSADDLVMMNNGIKEAIENRGIFDIVHAINILAMANTDVLHVFTTFSGHVKKFYVYAHPVETTYKKDEPQLILLSEYAFLDRTDALEKLLSIESQLTELIIEAREKAEAIAEVES